MSELSLASGAIDSAIHLEYIRTLAETGEEGGVEAVEAFHRSLFLQQNGRELERVQQQRQTSEDRLAVLEVRMREVLARMVGERPTVPVLDNGRPDMQPTAPWNSWDIAMFLLSGLAVVGLMVFGVLNVSFNLLESGIVTFSEHPIRAYFWAALLPVGALAVKVGWDVLQSRRLRSFYLWVCLGTGILAVLAWLGAYAAIYPTLSRTTADVVRSLSVFDGPGAGGEVPSELFSGGAKQIDMILVGAQALAEICLSAVLGMFMTLIYARHRPVRLVANPAWTEWERERETLDGAMARERLALADARGGETRLRHQLEVFVAYARSLYGREVLLRKDRGHQKRRLIEEMAEQLRSKLDALDQDPAPTNGDGVSTLSFHRTGDR